MYAIRSYYVVDNTKQLEKDNTYHYFKWSVESAGNLLAGLSRLSGRTKFQTIDEDTGKDISYYKIFNTRFAQYLKTDLEFRYGYRFDKYNSIVTRSFLGVAVPYGNFDVFRITSYNVCYTKLLRDQDFLNILRRTGFAESSQKRLSFGIATIYLARK